MKKLTLLIHHHALAYLDSGGNIHVASFIGRWVNALAEHIGEIRLLLYQSNSLLPQQDEIINKSNVILWSLGPPGKTWDRIPRMRRLRDVCRRASDNADGLLIRGSTPRQMSVWRYTDVPYKAFLLVGSLLHSKPVIKFGFWPLYERLMVYWRKLEVLNIAREGLLLANSPLLVDELEKLNAHAIFIPTNTLSIHEFPPLHIRDVSAPRRILFCGRVVPEKGIRELIHALDRLNKFQSYELDIVGPVNELFREELMNLARGLGISKKITWHGQIHYGRELMRFYQKADVFVLPTYFEGFPHVIWEAAANSCPVITTNVGGIPALWRDREHGILISAKDISSIVSAVTTLFREHALRSHLIENAYVYAKRFAVESCAERLVILLEKQGWSS